MNKINTYQQILKYLYSFIPQKQLLFTGEKGIQRTKYLLQLLGNPQEKLKVIHIAGTSGKGSTAYLISALLKKHGFKVGLQVSPHLLDIRERFQIYTNQNNDLATQILSHESLTSPPWRGVPSKVKNLLLPRHIKKNALISKKLFVKRLNEIIPLIEKAKKTEWGKLTYFEINVCLAFYIFWKEKVDYAVMETGLGGLFDGTNVVENPKKLVLLTKIGLDHQKVLGQTLSAIASQKAGIIKRGNTVITVQQKPTVERVFYSQCQKQKADLFILKKDKNFSDINISKNGNRFNFSFENLKLAQLQLSLIGKYQVENASIALAALSILGKRDSFGLNQKTVRWALVNVSFKGRFEIRKTKYREIIVDGAHNPQKMKAFISTLTILYPGQKFDFLIAFSEGKNQLTTMNGMLKQIVSLAEKIMLTDFRLEGNDVLHQSVDRKRIIKVLKQLNFNRYLYVPSDKINLQKIIREDKIPLVITGSLYFIGSIYKDLFL